MTPAMLRLESFSAPLPARPPEDILTRDDLERAFAQGRLQARAEAEDAQLSALTEGLARLADSLTQDEAHRRSLRAEAIAGLAPILHQILDLTAPPQASRRLEAALVAEMERLARDAAPLTARIACSERLHPMVERCLSRAGLSGIAVDTIPDDRVTLSLQGGTTEFAPDDIARTIRALIAEITQEDSAWTPQDI